MDAPKALREIQTCKGFAVLKKPLMGENGWTV
jgi:hypothetical protein